MMEDRRTVEGIINQIKDIEKNNWDTMEHITSIEMLLTSDNNGTDKDDEISQKFFELRRKMQEVIDSTNEIVFSLNENELE